MFLLGLVLVFILYIVVEAALEGQLAHGGARAMVHLQLWLLGLLGQHLDGERRVDSVHLVHVAGLQPYREQPFRGNIYTLYLLSIECIDTVYTVYVYIFFNIFKLL